MIDKQTEVKMKKNKQKTKDCQTLNGAPVYNVALSRNGVPMLGENMSFLTLSRTTGKLRTKAKQ